MKKNFKYYLQKCFEYVITHIFWYLFTTAVGFLALNIPKVIAYFKYNNSTLIKISNVFSFISLTLLFLSVIFLIISLTVFIKAKKAKQENTKDNNTVEKERKIEVTEDHAEGTTPINETEDSLLSQIHFKKVTISMNFKSCEDIEYTMKFEGYATKPNIDTFEKRLSWSGTEYISTTLVSSNIKAHIDDNIGHRNHSPYTFRISFDEDVVTNDKIIFTTKTLLSDETKCMIPLSSFCVKYPIDELVLKVSAPIGLLHTMRKKCYRDASRQLQVFSSKNVDQEEIEGYRIYSYPIKSPNPWMYYVLEWNFSEQY